MYSILSTIDKTFDDTCWQKYFELLKELNEKFKSRLSARTWHELKGRHLSFREKEKVYHSSVIYGEDRAVGWIVFWILNYETDHRITMVFFDARGEVFSKNLEKYEVGPAILRFVELQCQNIVLRVDAALNQLFGFEHIFPVVGQPISIQ